MARLRATMADCGKTTTISVGEILKAELEKEKNRLGIQTWNEFFLKTHKISPMLLVNDNLRESSGNSNNMVGLGNASQPIETVEDMKRVLMV